MNIKKSVFPAYILTLTGLLLWLGAILLAPALKDSSPGLSRFLYMIFEPTCHQNPNRCFALADSPLAVCTRCLGIYIGSLTGLFIYPFIKGFKNTEVPPVKTLILLSFPIVVDTTGNILSLWATPGWLRFCTGIIWGMILPYYFIAGISEAYIMWKKKKQKKKN